MFNPKTREPVEVGEKTRIRFKAFKGFKDSVNAVEDNIDDSVKPRSSKSKSVDSMETKL